MDSVSDLENALGAEMLRVKLLRRDPPTLAQRYVVEEILGRGASGIVVAGVDLRLNRAVALKIRPVEGDSSALAEARTLARLDHPNVVRVHDVDIAQLELDGRVIKAWIVSMPRVDGRTMRAWLRETPRSTAEILGVLVDVGRGLAAAHAERIVHRDVKPENILVGRDGVAQVLDFGFAVQSAPAQSDLDGVRPAAGTDPYMAPEARLGRTFRASDQFSLGITLVEALTGEPLPAGAKVPRDVPRDVWRIAQRATAPAAGERFADVAAMVDAMVRASKGGPSRGRVIALVVSGVVVCVVAVALVGRVHAPPPDASAVRVIDRDAGRRTMDATLLPIASTDAAVAVPASTDAGIDASPSARADSGSTRCLWLSGQYRFRTIDDVGIGPQGTYALGLDVRGGRVDEVSLRRTAPRRDQLEVRRVSARSDCSLVVEAHAESRDYAFELAIVGSDVRGTFHTSRGATYSGRVVPDVP